MSPNRSGPCLQNVVTSKSCPNSRNGPQVILSSICCLDTSWNGYSRFRRRGVGVPSIPHLEKYICFAHLSYTSIGETRTGTESVGIDGGGLLLENGLVNNKRTTRRVSLPPSHVPYNVGDIPGRIYRINNPTEKAFIGSVATAFLDWHEHSRGGSSHPGWFRTQAAR